MNPIGTQWVFLFALLLGLLAAQRTHADDPPPELAAALSNRLLSPARALEEVKAFIEPRVLRMPASASRAQWENTAAQLRRDMLEQVIFRGAAASWRDAPCKVEWLDSIDGGPGYRIRKLRYEALPGMWIPALLYVPDKLAGRVPLAVHVNGHAPEGKAVNYKQLRSINLAKRGMLVLDLEWFGMGQLRTPGFSHYRMNQLDLCGASGLAPFYLAMTRAIDLGLAHEHADPARVVVSGLSGGGWQTILVSSLDERVTLANPVAGYGSFRTNILFNDMGDSEQAPSDMAIVADYAHLTALRAPRPTLLTYNASDDCCFRSGHTLHPLLEAARPIFGLYNASHRLRSHVNQVPGTHNFEQENREQLYAAIGDYFYPGDSKFVRAEIPSEPEIKTAEQLHVPLPDANVDFHRLAIDLAKQLPADAQLPADKPAALAWQQAQREKLRALLRIPSYEKVSKTNAATQDVGKLRITSCTFKLQDTWTVPATEIRPVDPATGDSVKLQRTVLLVADAGRATLAAHIAHRAENGERIVAIDPLGWGESKLAAEDPAYLYPLMIAAVGERSLGVQAAQIIAIARHVHADSPDQPVTIVARGPRACMAALVAAATEPTAITAVELTDALSSLKQLITEDHTVETLPELFAFGFLRAFDMRQLAALVAPRPFTFRDPNAEARQEFEPLADWYALWGAKVDPMPE